MTSSTWPSSKPYTALSSTMRPCSAISPTPTPCQAARARPHPRRRVRTIPFSSPKPRTTSPLPSRVFLAGPPLCQRRAPSGLVNSLPRRQASAFHLAEPAMPSSSLTSSLPVWVLSAFLFLVTVPKPPSSVARVRRLRCPIRSVDAEPHHSAAPRRSTSSIAGELTTMLAVHRS